MLKQADAIIYFIRNYIIVAPVLKAEKAFCKFIYFLISNTIIFIQDLRLPLQKVCKM